MIRCWLMALCAALLVAPTALWAQAAADDQRVDVASADDDDDDDEVEDDDDDDEEGDEDDDFGDGDDDDDFDDEDDDEAEADGAVDDATGDEEDEELEGPFPGENRFFFDAPESSADKKKTAISGSLTSSSMYFRELGVDFAATDSFDDERTASDRLFTDLRAQLDAKHIGGSGWHFRGDVRGRFTPNSCGPDDDDRVARNPCIRVQSGTFGGEELEVREVYASRKSKSFELRAGRMFVLELAAHRLDGFQVRLQRSKALTLLGFAGLHPQKASRDIRQDYPTSAPQTDMSTKRIMPVTAGAGVAYRYEKLYGSFGAVGVLPLVEAADEPGGDGQLEDLRLFVSANGYFRFSPKVDLYHYAVLDVLGSAAFALTNVSLGVNLRPSRNLRVFGQVSRVDTETLTAVAQTKLEDPDDQDSNAIQNNIEVLRVAQDAARIGVSGSFAKRRYELSTTLALRQRPELTLTSPNGATTLVLGAAKDIEASVRFVDRRSVAGLRLGAQVSKSFGIGDDRFERSSTLVGKADASRGFADGKGEIEGYAMLVQSEAVPSGAGMACNVVATPDTFEACFGETSATTVTVGGLAFYRVSRAIIGVASTSIGAQLITRGTLGDMGTAAGEEPGTIIPFSFFLRLAYKF